MSNKLSMLSIKELFSEDENYIIPIYQRNYSWKLPQLRQLIQDIWDSCNYNFDRNYYIGSLVVYPTDKGFETVDGQQRLTTLNIMLIAMKNVLEEGENPYPWFKGPNVDFEFREKSSNSLQKLYTYDSPSNIDDNSIAYMYEHVGPMIEDVLTKNSDHATFEKNFKKFRDYLFDNVIVVRMPLPNETDLNHYFEIMNTRGEQLEKHEILKARILYPLKTDAAALWLGNRIWEACSDMSKYVQMGFADPELRKCIFSNDLNTIKYLDFDSLVASTRHLIKQENDSLFSIKNIIDCDKSSSTKLVDSSTGSYNEVDAERFSSVIDFPNLLLQVLRVITRDDIPLDDKRLLDTFPKKPDREFSKNFLYQLLRLRYLFDNFIIRRDLVDERRRGKWSILKIKVQENKGLSYNNSFEKNQRENIMLQSMFHVSLPSQNYKHWLCGALLHLSKNSDGKGLYEYLTQLSHAYMRDRYLCPGDTQLDYYEIIFKNDGRPKQKCPNKLTLPRFDTNIDIFFFNFLDMQLWLQGNEPDFNFTARNSIEHFYPQNPMDNFPPLEEKEYLHSFGNLCLIGSGKNSRLSNFPPAQKTEFYEHSSIDSIKQKLMMKICKDNVKKNKDGWTVSDIRSHSDQMEAVLVKSLR